MQKEKHIKNRAKDPQRLADFIDWLYSAEGMEIAGHAAGAAGPEGLTWELKDGRPVYTEFGMRALPGNDVPVPEERGGGSWKNVVPALNFKALSPVDIEPKTKEPYMTAMWSSVLEKDAAEIELDWREYAGGAKTSRVFAMERRMSMSCYRNEKHMLYGGDYNPEQWPKELWEEDMRLMKQAHINIVTLNVFSWAALQPDEDTYDFTKLDEIMALVRANGMNVCLATSTGAYPAWMARRHPDILRTEKNGTKRKFGGRHNACPNSRTYRKYAPKLAAKLAERYRDYDNIVAWHVSNEYGGECYCENCEKAFRIWLQKRYGTLDEVNRVFYTDFWGRLSENSDI